MPKLTFVIGVTATGKTYFIKEHYADQDVEILNEYDYQQCAHDEAGVGDNISFDLESQCISIDREIQWAKTKLLEDVIAKLAQGRDVVVEHTLLDKAKRRIAYIDEIRRQLGDAEDAVTIAFYVMQPTDERWGANFVERNLKEERNLRNGVKLSKGEAENLVKWSKPFAEELEFPNVAEGIDEIYEVVDGEIRMHMNPPTPDIVEPAREELRQEKEAQRKAELLVSMKTRKFWHYCEVCGKKEFITAGEAFDGGWDYPHNIGFFGVLGPRICGDCQTTDTLYWRIQTGKIQTCGRLPIVLEGELSPEELVTWRRIKGEPESLLVEEAGND